MPILISTKDAEQHVGLFFVPEEDEAKKKTVPLVMAFSIDMSGSMKNMVESTNFTRWEITLECINELVIDRLNSSSYCQDDRLCVVSYNTTATLQIPFCKLENWDEHYQILKNLKPENYTNISAGDELVFDVLSKNCQKNSRVLIISLTDGQPNKGITNMFSIAQAKKEQLKMLEDNGIIVTSAFYAISSSANAGVSRICSSEVGSDRSIWKKIENSEFDEFSGEFGSIFNMCQLVETVEYNSKVFRVLKGVWCPHTITGEIDDLVISLPNIGNLLMNDIDNSMTIDDDDDDDDDDDEVKKNLQNEFERLPKFLEKLSIDGPSSKKLMAMIENMISDRNEVINDISNDIGMLRRFSMASESTQEVCESYKSNYKKRHLKKVTDDDVVPVLQRTKRVCFELVE